MAVVFMDGFDSYNGTAAPNGMGGRHTLTGTNTTTTGRFGGLAYLSNTAFTSTVTSPAFTAVSSFSCGFGFQKVSHATTAREVIRFNNGATNHVGIGVNTDGSIYAARNGTLLGTSAASLMAIGTWYTVEVEVVISDTVGRVTVYLDGASVLNLTSQDTRNGATSDVTVVQIGNITGSGIASAIDDLYITDSATKPTNALRIETLVPNGDGGTLNFTLSTGTSHFAVVDELPANTTDYASGSAIGNLDELDLTDLSATPTAIEAVQVGAVWLKTDATARQMALEVKSGATTSTGGNYVLTTTGDKATRLLTTDPNTGAAWTASAVNALKTRTKVTV